MNASPSLRILVGGATGYIGGGVAKSLRRAGHTVRALARDPRRLSPTIGAQEVFVGEATRRDSIRGCCDGVDVVFSSLGLRSFSRTPSLWEVDYQANIHLLEEARRAGVKRFIFVSVIHGPLLARTCPIAEAREMVVQAIVASGMDYTVVRPTGFFNDMAEFYRSAQNQGRVWVLGDGKGLINPLSAMDLGDEVARSLREPQPRRLVRSVGGPQDFTHRAVAEAAFRVLGKPPKIHNVPKGLLSGFLPLLKPLHENAYGLGTFFRFVAVTDDVRGEALGTRRLESFFQGLRAGLSIPEADDAARPLASESSTESEAPRANPTEETKTSAMVPPHGSSASPGVQRTL